MAYFIETLPDILDEGYPLKSTRLPRVYPLFSLEKLGEEPQDTITAHLPPLNPDETAVQVPLIEPEILLEEKKSLSPPNTSSDALPEIWLNPALPPDRHRLRVLEDNTLTWDRLGNSNSYQQNTIGSPYLSEMTSSEFAAARYHIKPVFDAEQEHRIHISLSEFYDALSANVFGNSSSLYVWNKATDTFDLRGCPTTHRGVVVVDDLDERSIMSLVHRFLSVGTLIRRLEDLVLSLRSGSHEVASASLAHGLANIIGHLHSTSLSVPEGVTRHHLSALWIHYEEPEHTLSVLAVLCFREFTRTPPYPPLNIQSSSLANRIHHLLSIHIALRSPLSVRGSLAYLLTIISQPIFEQLGHSLGLVSRSKFPSLFAPADRSHGEGTETNGLSTTQQLPDFIIETVSDQITRAHRSLELLAAATPDHPLVHTDPEWEALCQGWLWTETRVEELVGTLERHVTAIHFRIDEWRWHHGALYGKKVDRSSVLLSSSSPILPKVDVPVHHSVPQTDQFRIFDLEPGSHLELIRASTDVQSTGGSSIPYEVFLENFPEDLPWTAPTLDTLADLVGLQPLVSHARILSSSLLDLFLSDLDFLAHLDLLHRFMLFGDPSFSNRVRDALFIDGADDDVSRPRQRFGSVRKGRDAEHFTKHWGVGLNPSLSDRGTWPPGGSEIAFSLRRVIVDTLDDERTENEDGDLRTGGGRKKDEVWNEAEWRLGFIIRNMEEDDEGQEIEPSWLDPMSIGALDFLDMDYKPPPTIATLITSDILNKYRRVFNFLLRLLRVDSVARVVFRSGRTKEAIRFTQSSTAQQRLDHFRFQANSFLHILTSYITDSAIGANYNSFVSRLVRLRHGVEEQHVDEEDQQIEISDVFSILDYHSAIMDRILEACFLKARHRTVGGTSMMDCLESILHFGKLLVDLKSGKLSEQIAERRLIKIHDAFTTSLRHMISGLEMLDESGQAKRSRFADAADLLSGDRGSRNAELSMLVNGDTRRSDASSLSDLLLRLDSGGFWKKDRG